jgi:sulfhydrogenase subunit gamma (sulfur reductase)
MIDAANAILKKKGIKEDRIYVSLERQMKCGIGVCCHCSIGKKFVCKEGPVFRLDRMPRE